MPPDAQRPPARGATTDPTATKRHDHPRGYRSGQGLLDDRGSVVPTGPAGPFSADHQARRRAWIRRQLHEARAVLDAGLHRGEPLGGIANHAHQLISDALVEAMRAALDDE